MANLMLPVDQESKLNELSVWLRETTGHWPMIEDTTLVEDGKSYPMKYIVLKGRWTEKQLQVVWVDRTKPSTPQEPT